MIRKNFDLRALARDERGVTLVEFALVSIPLLIILFAGFGVAHRLYVDSVLQGALTDAARRATVEDPTLTGTAGLTIEERVAEMVTDQVSPIAPGATITVTQENFYEFSGIGNPEKIVTDNDGDGVYDDTDGDCFEDLNENGSYDTDTGRTGRGGANDVAFYQATLTMDELFPTSLFIGGSDQLTITADVAIRNQPWGVQATPPVICGVVP